MPISVNSNGSVYSKEEIDDILILKADKVIGAVQDHIVDLIAIDGNISDSGYSIADLLFNGTFIDGGIVS